MDKVVSIDKDALLVKNEMEKLTSSFTAKMKEKDQKSKKRKRAIRDKGKKTKRRRNFYICLRSALILGVHFK